MLQVQAEGVEPSFKAFMIVFCFKPNGFHSFPSNRDTITLGLKSMTPLLKDGKESKDEEA